MLSPIAVPSTSTTSYGSLPTCLAPRPTLSSACAIAGRIILEDEAQDSSKLQEEILSTLAGPDGNWVRVGDPNQAIFETFTTADPELLRAFIRQNESVPMPESGRCQPSIMDLANYLVKWTMEQHPVEAIRDALSGPPILPAPPGDPQPNPPDDPAAISLDSGKLAPQEEVIAVARSIQEWLPTHKDATVAVLTSTNDHAANMVKALQARGIRCRELLRSTSPTRAVAGALSYVLGSLSDPASPQKLAQAYRVWRRDWRSDKARQLLVDRVAGRLEKLGEGGGLSLAFTCRGRPRHRRARLCPQETGDDLDLTDDEVEAVQSELADFRGTMGRWHAAVVLPIDQLVLTLAQDIFTSVPDLALAHKLALVMAQLAARESSVAAAGTHPSPE